MSPREDLYTPEEAATYLRVVKTSTLNKWRAEGRGPRFCKLGAKVAYKRAALDAWLDKNEQEASCHSIDDQGPRIGGTDSAQTAASTEAPPGPTTTETPSASSAPSGQRLTVALVNGVPQVRRIS